MPLTAAFSFALLAVAATPPPQGFQSTATSAHRPAPRAVRPERKVLVIGVDGVRPDALIAANTPNFDALIAAGAFSAEAQTGDITSSGPGWSSMLTAVWRDKHGVDDNSFAGSNYGQYPHFFRRVKEHDPSLFTASFVHWTPIHTYILSDADVAAANLSDAQVAAQAANLFTMGDPDVVFLHFDDVDGAGHTWGYSPTVPQYLAAIQTVDGHVGTVIAALQARPTYAQEDWLVVSSTDHGGVGTGHGGNTPEQRTIYMIASSPSVTPGTITPAPDIVDVPAVALTHLEIPIDPVWNWDGHSFLGDVGCPFDFAAEADQVAKTVALSWKVPAIPPGATGLELFRNGQSIATLPVHQAAFLDTPTLPADEHVALDYRLDVLGGTCPDLTGSAALSGGQVVFADDFEDYPSDFELVFDGGWNPVDVAAPVENAFWSLANIGGRANPPRADGTPSTGRFLISDSDAGGSGANSNTPGSGMSHDVWTPPFDCSGLAAVHLHASCSAQLNDNGDAIFDVDVSTDGGANWSNAFRRIAPLRTVAPFATNQDCDGFFGRLDVDLTALAAGQSDVRVRFRHFEPSWDWWIAIDDVLVDDVDLTTGGGATLLGPETFSAGIPVGWTVSGLNTGTETWHTTDKGNRYNAGAVSGHGVNRIQHPDGSPSFAMLDSDANPDPAEDELLITPAVDCSGRTRVFLHFASEQMHDSGATCEVLVSLDGGLTFLAAPVFSYSGGGAIQGGQEPVFAQRVFPVPEAAGQPNVAFAFRYASPGNRWWWAVDDASVTAD